MSLCVMPLSLVLSSRAEREIFPIASPVRQERFLTEPTLSDAEGFEMTRFALHTITDLQINPIGQHTARYFPYYDRVSSQ